MARHIPPSIPERLIAAVIDMEHYPVTRDQRDQQLVVLEQSFYALDPLEQHVLASYYTHALTQQTLARRLGMPVKQYRRLLLRAMHRKKFKD